MMSDAAPFFPNTYLQAMNRIGMLAMNRGTNHPRDAARTAAEMLETELASGLTESLPIKTEGRLNGPVRALKEAINSSSHKWQWLKTITSDSPSGSGKHSRTE